MAVISREINAVVIDSADGAWHESGRVQRSTAAEFYIPELSVIGKHELECALKQEPLYTQSS